MYHYPFKPQGPPREDLLASLQATTLYGILDIEYTSEEAAVEVAEDLIKGGVGIIQLRAKCISTYSLRQIARDVLPLARAASIPFLINDFPDIAAEVGADGAHIGQDGGSLAEARKILGPDALIGRSTHSPEQARQAESEGFDYIGFGPLYATPTKPGRPAIGLDHIAEVVQHARLPVFCIGGINRRTLPNVVAAGATRIVAVSAILQATDPPAEAKLLQEMMKSET